MCIGKRCGVFRRYEVTNIILDSYWGGDSLEEPSDPSKIKPLSALSELYQQRAVSAFEAKIRSYWSRVDHSGEGCPRGCICVETLEVDGAPSKPQNYLWVDHLELQLGSTSVDEDIVAKGVYTLSFIDYVGKCHLAISSTPQEDAGEAGD